MTVADPAAQSVQLHISVTNPVTGEQIGALPIMNELEVAAAVARARAAQPAWAALGVKARTRILRRWIDSVWRDRETMMRVIRRETGKTDPGAFVEIAVLDVAVNYYIAHAPHLLRPQRRSPLFPLVQRAQVVYHPYGVAGFISPWNYPYFNALTDLVPALIAGNAVVLKPSEIAPYSAIEALDRMHAAGVPREVAQIVTGDGTTGSALINTVDCIAFTGSTATGRQVAVRAAERLIPCSLELGGKDPLIVLDDANLATAVAGALRSALENAGQACISIERIYVEAGIYDAFVAGVVEAVQNVTLGAGDGLGVHIGCMTNERELLRTEAHISDALEKGATLRYGGKRRPDLGALFFEPTILTEVDHTMRVMREETFGPIVPIMRVRDADEAVRYANDSPYGLSASLYTRNLKRGEQIAQRIESGDVSINRPQMVIGTPSLPMGGVKASGLGRRNGPEGLLRFVKSQSILSDTLLISIPALTFTDPLSQAAFRAMRFIRRVLPFV